MDAYTSTALSTDELVALIDRFGQLQEMHGDAASLARRTWVWDERRRDPAAAIRGAAGTGHTEVATECDAVNPGSKALLEKAGGTIVGGTIEFVRHR
jgi:hypothetical protein